MDKYKIIYLNENALYLDGSPVIDSVKYFV